MELMQYAQIKKQSGKPAAIENRALERRVRLQKFLELKIKTLDTQVNLLAAFCILLVSMLIR